LCLIDFVQFFCKNFVDPILLIESLLHLKNFVSLNFIYLFITSSRWNLSRPFSSIFSAIWFARSSLTVSFVWQFRHFSLFA
jgi:hypothetical protein